jgi:hypothetical protein
MGERMACAPDGVQLLVRFIVVFFERTPEYQLSVLINPVHERVPPSIYRLAYNAPIGFSVHSLQECLLRERSFASDSHAEECSVALVVDLIPDGVMEGSKGSRHLLALFNKITALIERGIIQQSLRSQPRSYVLDSIEMWASRLPKGIYLEVSVQ